MTSGVISSMRLFGLVARDGFDPFSLSHELDVFWREQAVQPNEALFVYESDPAYPIAKAWGDMKGVHVVNLPEGQDMVKDYVACLLVVESPYVLLPDPRDVFIRACIEQAEECGRPVATLMCSGCPA